MNLFLWRAFLWHAVLMLLTLSCAEVEAPKYTYQEYATYKNNDPDYIQHYVPKDLVFFSDIHVSDEGSTLKVAIQFHHSYGQDAIIKFYSSGTWLPFPDDVVQFHLQKGDTAVIKNNIEAAVFRNEKQISRERLLINFYPKEYYALSNYYAPGYIIIQKENADEIPYIKTPLEHWTTTKPSADDIAFAQQEWGSLIAASDDLFERARIIQKAIIKKLNPYQGVPSSELEKLSPFDQYRRLVKGDDRLWCGNWAGIYSHALACFGYTVRQVALGKVYDDTGEPVVLLAEGHRIMEVFDDKTYRWKVIDLTFFMIEARYQGQPLNAFDLHYMINHPAYRNQIELLEYDAEQSRERKVKLLDSQYADRYFNYYPLNQSFRFLTN